MDGSSGEHMEQAARHVTRHPVACAVLTVSDTRTQETDAGGALVATLLEDAGHQVPARSLVPDDPDPIDHQIRRWLADSSIHAILTTGGTGIGRRDTTADVAKDLLDVEIVGFGELFRLLSWEQVGAAAMMSRAVGGLVKRPPNEGGETLLFCMPGSVNAIKTAMTGLIIPQLAHLVWERRSTDSNSDAR